MWNIKKSLKRTEIPHLGHSIASGLKKGEELLKKKLTVYLN